MRWSIVLVLVLGGCGFHVAAGSDPPRDAEADATSDGRTIDGPARVACDTMFGSDLVACYELEDGVSDGVLLDSAPAHRDAIATGLTATTRGTSMAAVVTPSARAFAPDSAALDLPAAYTVAVWVRPNTHPMQGDVQGLLDHEGQYAMLVGNTGAEIQARCVHTGVSRYEWTTSPPLATWSWFVCTWDGTAFCAYRWTAMNDHQHYCHRPTVPPASGGTNGLAIGHLSDLGLPEFPLDGALDSVQVFQRALTAAELCTQLGRPANCMPCDACTN